MVHLTIHLAIEAKLDGPIQYRWMYPIKRYLFTLKNYIRNRNRPEGSIAEGYLVEEATIFCERYLNNVPTKLNKSARYNEDPIGSRVSSFISADEARQAHRCILFNTDEVLPYLE